MFHVIETESLTPYPSAATPYTYETGNAAAIAARSLTELHGKKYRPKPITDDTWKERESSRFASGEYMTLPWSGESWFKDSPIAQAHFAHTSKAKPGMVAFTADAAKGTANIQTRVKPGKYLQDHFADTVRAFGVLRTGDRHADAGEQVDMTGADAVRYWAVKLAGASEPFTLEIAETADEIEDVYTSGPESCMSHGTDDYATGGIHPSRVYAGHGLAVAFMRADEGRITARALIWPSEKQSGRIYGDYGRLNRLLKDAGYSRGSFIGAKLARIECGDAFVCPYLDHGRYVDDCGSYLGVTESGEYDANQTNGLCSADDRPTCARCDERMNGADSRYMETLDQSWCESCVASEAFYCHGRDEYMPDDAGIAAMTIDGRTYSTSWLEDGNGFYCAKNRRWYLGEDCVVLQSGETWSLGAFELHGVQCPHCDEAIEAGTSCANCPEENPEGPRGHAAKPGRDESPDQIELVLAAIKESIQ